MHAFLFFFIFSLTCIFGVDSFVYFQCLKRVRVGIGRPDNRHDVTSYVLSNFEPSEIPVIQDTVEKCCKVLMAELQSLMSQSSSCQNTDSGANNVQFQVQL